ncbi:hypothetical protein MPL3365_70521 [Mesorhizobium plurifarium]|uniref:Uncharacterized protein n=1 Tax=Mesorhizobium plurifarium TaxID=69974 RepID=A0A090GW70_MESPL|nr:hypothetical protein MPL3365_70521 [Mesorhizobium plurifarium]
MIPKSCRLFGQDYSQPNSIKHAHQLTLLKPASGLEWRHGLLVQAIQLTHMERAPKGALFVCEGFASAISV